YREVCVSSVQVLERVQIPGWRKPCLRTRDIESDHPVVAIPDRQFRDFQRPCVLTHRAHQRSDGYVPAAFGSATFAVSKAFLHRLDDLVERGLTLEEVVEAVQEGFAHGKRRAAEQIGRAYV